MTAQAEAYAGIPARNDGSGAEALEWLFAITMSLVISAYPLAGLFATLTGVESTLVTIPYRSAILGMCIATAFFGLLGSRKQGISIWLFLFLIIYALRLIYDTYLDFLIGADVAWVTFIGITAPPVAAAMFAAGYYDPRKFLLSLAVISTIASGALALVGALNLNLEGISSLEQTGNRLDFATVNAITIGQTGATALACALAIFFSMGMRKWTALTVLAVVLGTWAVIQSGSRGPFVGLAFSTLLLLMVRGNVRGIFMVGLLAIFAVIQLDVLQSTILERLSLSFQDASSLERLQIQSDALAQFLANPATGSAYAELTTMQYPHNLELEAAMALGLGGLVLVFLLLLRAAREILAGMATNDLIVPLIASNSLLFAQFSGSIWGGSILFTTLAILTGGYALNRRRKASYPVSAPSAASERPMESGEKAFVR